VISNPADQMFHRHKQTHAERFDKEKLRAHFDIPEDFTVGAVWALGYLGDPEALSDFLKKIELTPRQRRPLSEMLFSSASTNPQPSSICDPMKLQRRGRFV